METCMLLCFHVHTYRETCMFLYLVLTFDPTGKGSIHQLRNLVPLGTYMYMYTFVHVCIMYMYMYIHMLHEP